MASRTLSQIEQQINQLSYQDQLSLLEKIVHSLRKKSFEKEIQETDLFAMANDSEIQSEIKNINQEFSVTETDGLQ